MGRIRLLISDFDGTLVDTFRSNYMAYRDAFLAVGSVLSEETYRECFGYRFDKFMDAVLIDDWNIRERIRQLKKEFYPNYFGYLRPNGTLVSLLRDFKDSGGLTALASTARRENLVGALSYIGARDIFSYIIAGEDVSKGKPDPEIYHTVLSTLRVAKEEALVFEDSEVGMQAAAAAGIPYIQINQYYFYGDTSERP